MTLNVTINFKTFYCGTQNHKCVFALPGNSLISQRSISNSIFKSLRESQKVKVSKSFNDSFRVKAGRGFINWLKTSIYIFHGSITASVARASVVYIRFLYRLYQSGGIKLVVLYTKTCTILLMQAGQGMNVAPHSLGCAVSRTRDGLPRLIPKLHRQRIRRGESWLFRV